MDKYNALRYSFLSARAIPVVHSNTAPNARCQGLPDILPKNLQNTTMADVLAQHFTSLGVFISDYSDLYAPASSKQASASEPTAPPHYTDKQSTAPPPYGEHGAHKLVETSGDTPHHVASSVKESCPEPLPGRDVVNGRQDRGESQVDFEIGPELTLIPVERLI